MPISNRNGKDLAEGFRETGALTGVRVFFGGGMFTKADPAHLAESAPYRFFLIFLAEA